MAANQRLRRAIMDESDPYEIIFIAVAKKQETGRKA